jgi:hypothetical protein
VNKTVCPDKGDEYLLTQGISALNVKSFKKFQKHNSMLTLRGIVCGQVTQNLNLKKCFNSGCNTTKCGKGQGVWILDEGTVEPFFEGSIRVLN